jgi:tRNA threonylcarbamoyladenosine biosynthesis protein TsaE
MLNTESIIQKENISSFAGELIAELKTEQGQEAVVVALCGDLGAGKTTLVQTMGKLLGVAEIITSPTFTIIKRYDTNDDTFESLVHIDAYRIESLGELGPLRFSELLTLPKTLICIEWAEKIQAALPKNVLNVTLSVVDENARTVHISRL